MEERSFLEGQRHAARVEEDLQEMDAEEASNDATALSFVHAIKTMVRKATTENQLEFMTVDQRNELIRILRKSSDFRSDHELDHLMTMFHHIHFPSAVRIPGRAHFQSAASSLGLTDLQCALSVVRFRDQS
jgi:hypothetical protein